MKKLDVKVLASFLLLALLALFVGGCTNKKLDTDLHIVLIENPKSLDPISTSDAIAAEATNNVYETLLQYHYTKRPYTLIPALAEGMPDYSRDGLIVTIHLKKNLRFQDDPCFADGKGREVVASDFIFAWLRLSDPRNQSDGWWILDGKIEGLNEWRKKATEKGADYHASIAGLQALDRYTLKVKLLKKYPQFNNVITMVYTAPVPHEAVEKYGAEFSNHPVGTGPFFVKEYMRNSKIIYERNKNFRFEFFPPQSDTPELSGFDFGKKLPFADRIVAHILIEDQPSWLQFLSGQVDLLRLPKDNYSKAITENHELQPALLKKGMELSRNPSTTEWFIGFNMDDPVVGKNKLLRKAIGLAYDSDKDIQLFTNGLGRATNQILPPPIEGYIPEIASRKINVEEAKKLLATAGFPGGEGLPTLTFDVEGASRQRQLGEFFKSQMSQIGIKVDVRSNSRPQLMDRKRKGKLQIHMDGWIADYPDAENYLQLLYSPNHPPGSNNSAFNNHEYDTLYEQMAGMQPSPGRQKLIQRMTEVFLEESPWIPNWVATLYYLNQGWLKNYVYSDFGYNNYKYYRVDLDQKREMLKRF